jgi:hypothetical protein
MTLPRLPIIIAATIAAIGGSPRGPVRAQAQDVAMQPACDSVRVLVGRVGGVMEDEYRLAQIDGSAPLSSMMLRRSEPGSTAAACRREWLVGAGRQLRSDSLGAVAFTILPVDAAAGYRSGYDGGRNDELMWQGRGLSAQATAGIHVDWQFLHATLAPAVAYQQNREFEILPPNADQPFANAWYPTSLDIPQRFGPDAYWSTGWGQSSVHIAAGPIAAGLSNQNMWWGPGIENALLMTNTAPGFAHVFLSSSHPVDIGIGDAEFSVVLGRLRESEWFDTVSTNNKHLFRAVNVVLQPAILPGLYVGGARAFVGSWPDEFNGIVKELFRSPFAKNRDSNSPGSQLLSFFARWVMPASGFELYSEWGREDHSADLKDFLEDPEHSQAWIFGFQKVVPRGPDRVRVAAEWAHMQEFTPPRPERSISSWYKHGGAGYTNEGQWLGTATGTGGNSQHLRVDLLQNGRSIGLYAERIKRYDLAYYDHRPGANLYFHDVEITGGGRAQVLWQDLLFSPYLEYSKHYTRLFRFDDRNVSLGTSLTFIPGR